VKQFYCSLFGHDYKVVKKVTYHVKEYKCKHCSQHMTTNGQGKLTLMTPKFREINSILERIHTKKVRRKQLMFDR
jgi:hypothetical protein